MKLQNRPPCNNGTQDSILVLGDRVALVVVGVGWVRHSSRPLSALGATTRTCIKISHFICRSPLVEWVPLPSVIVFWTVSIAVPARIWLWNETNVQFEPETPITVVGASVTLPIGPGASNMLSMTSTLARHFGFCNPKINVIIGLCGLFPEEGWWVQWQWWPTSVFLFVM